MSVYPLGKCGLSDWTVCREWLGVTSGLAIVKYTWMDIRLPVAVVCVSVIF